MSLGGQSSEHSSVTRKALLTVGLGGATFLITNALNQPQHVQITLSILIGGIALILRFLVDFENRLAAVEQLEKDGMTEMKHLVGDAFSQISEATELFGLIEASALQTDLVTQLVRNSTQISPTSPPIVYHFVQAKIKEMSDFLKQLAEGGTVTYYGEDRDWLLGLTRNATVSIDAISWRPSTTTSGRARSASATSTPSAAPPAAASGSGASSCSTRPRWPTTRRSGAPARNSATCGSTCGCSTGRRCRRRCGSRSAT
jgi:hypothetical protein